MGMIDSSAAIANDMLFRASRDGLLYVFGSERIPADPSPYVNGDM